MKAHQLQVKLAEFTNEDNHKYQDEKDKKMSKEIQKLKTKQENEFNNLNNKMKKDFNEFNLRRAAELDIILLSHKNRLKELDSAQRLELNNFDKIQKGITSKIIYTEPSGRADMIVHSATYRTNGTLANAKN
jgi:hypothetical protein